MKAALSQARFAGYIKNNNLFLKNHHILAAVSGGVDSVVMCDLLNHGEFKFSIAHMNFQLRKEESKKDEKFVKELAEKYHVEFYGSRVDTKSYAKQHSISIEMAARELRYSWFDDLLDQKRLDYVATAHHLNDQTESILLNLVRGTVLKGKQGIKSKNHRLIRPLLFAERKEIEQYAQERNLAYRVDKSNESLEFQRNRIRKNVIPELEKINPSLHETIGRNADYYKTYVDFVQHHLKNIKSRIVKQEQNLLYIDYKTIEKDSFLKLYLFEILNEFGFKSDQIQDIAGSLNKQPGIQFMSHTHKLVKDREQLIVSPLQFLNRDPVQINDFVSLINFHDYTFSFQLIGQNEIEDLKDPLHAYLDFNKLKLPLEIRYWKSGDQFMPYGFKGMKKLSDYLTDLRLNRIEKENTIVLISGTNIVWIASHRIDDRFKVNEDSKRILKIVVKQK